MILAAHPINSPILPQVNVNFVILLALNVTEETIIHVKLVLLEKC